MKADNTFIQTVAQGELNPLKKRTKSYILHINTKYREIKTKIPCHGTEEVLKKLDTFESRSMHGQLPLVWDSAYDSNIFDSAGNKFLDFTSAIFFANVGEIYGIF